MEIINKVLLTREMCVIGRKQLSVRLSGYPPRFPIPTLTLLPPQIPQNQMIGTFKK